MFRGVLVTFPPGQRGGKIVPVNIEGVPDRYGRFEVEDSYRGHDLIEHFEHEMSRRYERRIPTPSFADFIPDKTPAIEKVIFNDPATIVIWKDKTKTVVKCQEGDTYSPELGLAMCIAKKYLGNKGNFNEVFKKWIPEDVPVKSGLTVNFKIDGEALGKAVSNAMYNLGKSLVRDYEPKTDIPKVGTRIKIIDTKSGCKGAIGKVGVVTNESHTDGLLDEKPGYNVELSNGRIWKIHIDSKIEILE